jgi:translation elongation factor EF-1alpha
MILDVARKIGYPGSICSIPVSDRHISVYSTSLTQAQVTMPWYQGWRKDLGNGQVISGTSLVEAIDSIGFSCLKPQNTRPFRATVSSKYVTPWREPVVKVISGKAKVGTILKSFPENIPYQISDVKIVLTRKVYQDCDTTGEPGTYAKLMFR